MPSLLNKVLEPAIGLAAEAIAHHKEKSRSRTNITQTDPNAENQPSSSSISSSRTVSVDPNTSPPEYTPYSDEIVESGVSEEKRSTTIENHKDQEEDLQHDENDWNLDSAAELANPTSYDETLDNEDIPTLIQSVLKNAKPPTGIRLPLPVILPQRRPRDKGRGFVRAYSPVLEDTGIDQETFLRFLKAFHQSSQASKTWNVILISAGIAGFTPSLIAMGVTTAISIAAGIAKEVQTRQRTNTFLDEMNQKLFMPRGLIALIMTFKPDPPVGIQSGNLLGGLSSAVSGLFSRQELDINQSITKYYMNDSITGMKKKMQNLRSTSGKTHGELSMPDAAPLIYPTLEEVANAVAQGKDGEEQAKKASAFKRSGKCTKILYIRFITYTNKFIVVSDYFDRRAQARYAAENPNSSLNSTSGPQFASKLANPTYNTQGGGIINTLSDSIVGKLGGGIIGPRSGGTVNGGRRNPPAERSPYGGQERMVQNVRGSSNAPEPGQPGYQPQGVKRLIQQDVLYLTIVNMPTDEELQMALATMQSIQNTK